MTIINNTGKTFTPDEQQVIKKAMSDYGLDKVITAKHPNDGGNDTLYNFYDDESNYVFSIDTDADGECIIW